MKAHLQPLVAPLSVKFWQLFLGARERAIDSIRRLDRSVKRGQTGFAGTI
jgi:hypothetical protein